MNSIGLSGEYMIIRDERHQGFLPCIVEIRDNIQADCNLVLTNYRVTSKQLILAVVDRNFHKTHRVKPEYFNIPLKLIDTLTKDIKNDSAKFVITTKDNRTLRVNFIAQFNSEIDMFSLIFDLVNSKSLSEFFAFYHKVPGEDSGWDVYDCIGDLERNGGDFSYFKMISNSIGEFCETYPRFLVVPNDMSTAELLACAEFRSSKRLPVVTWLGANGKVSLWRCSQPKVGLNFRSAADERMLELIAATSNNCNKLQVLDARPSLNAAVNRFKGGGFETARNYPQIDFKFLDIPNIHVVRSSFETMQKSLNEQPTQYLRQVEKSNWLIYLSLILKGARLAAEQLDRGVSVLVHCSDGWDRTPQITALTQILVDSHYRTLVGFCQLVEKEWVEFGHMFSRRLGHMVETTKKSKRSQVFLQFLDAVHQLLKQYPNFFEFNEKLLLELAHHAYSCRFGTFLLNSNQERRKADVFKHTPSIWSYVLRNAKQFLNPFYQIGLIGTIHPNCSPLRLEIWHGLFSIWHEDFYTYADNRSLMMEEINRSLDTLKVVVENKESEIEMLRDRMHSL
mmetsp:Transcript_13619/g.25698  ORF Transcript_13619/g.25698 Transcript_13619/m.25698 type:complete len:564 (+) Transcript_13619:607-2298(+)